MISSKGILKMVVLSMLVALGVVISPILRFEGMCPMAHFINIVCAVLMGPWYALLCATVIGIIRMALLGIPPLALTGAVFGAFLSGVFYKMSKGKLIFAVLGEVIGTGIIGALVSVPVMKLFWGKEGIAWFFYIPTFICGTLIGGSIAFVFLKKLAGGGMLQRFQNMLGSAIYQYKSSHVENSCTIAALGVILFLVIKVLTIVTFPGKPNVKILPPVWSTIAYIVLALFILAAVIYFFAKKKKVDAN